MSARREEFKIGESYYVIETRKGKIIWGKMSHTINKNGQWYSKELFPMLNAKQAIFKIILFQNTNSVYNNFMSPVKKTAMIHIWDILFKQIMKMTDVII